MAENSIRGWKKLDLQGKRSFVSQLVHPKKNRGLEIGPYINPMVQRGPGVRIEYLEAMDSDGLRERCRSAGLDPNKVPEIDFVFREGRTLSELTGTVKRDDRYDYVVSSHVLEHLPDPVRHFQEVGAVLNESGIYVAIIPDARLCLDCLKPRSSLGEVLEAFLTQRKHPTIAAYVDELRYGCTLDGKAGWDWDSDGNVDLRAPTSLNLLKGLVRQRTSEFVPDSWGGHLWNFSPASFVSIFYDLSELGLTQLSIVELRPTGHMDFIVAFAGQGSRHVPLCRADALERAHFYGTSWRSSVKAGSVDCLEA